MVHLRTALGADAVDSNATSGVERLLGNVSKQPAPERGRIELDAKKCRFQRVEQARKFVESRGVLMGLAAEPLSDLMQ